MSDHHKRQEYCRTRLRYRSGRQLKAVKVYCIVNESVNLLVFGVPKIDLKHELKRSFQRFGSLVFAQNVTEILAKKVELEPFTDVFHVKFAKIEHARRAKRFLDAHEFYGGILHISYAPEYESTEELRQKFKKRRQEVEYRMRLDAKKESQARV